MYSRLWRVLPGGVITKAALCAVGLVLVGLALWHVVFPFLESHTAL
ncbi:hypothetical protein [Planotetraspora thailandica]